MILLSSDIMCFIIVNEQSNFYEICTMYFNLLKSHVL